MGINPDCEEVWRLSHGVGRLLRVSEGKLGIERSAEGEQNLSFKSRFRHHVFGVYGSYETQKHGVKYPANLSPNIPPILQNPKPFYHRQQKKDPEST